MPFKCYICGATYKQEKGLDQHISSLHEGKKSFKCYICNGRFAQKGSLNIHIKSVHEKEKHKW